MNTHETVRRIELEKQKQHAREELLKIANMDIERFIAHTMSRGVAIGLKWGFILTSIFWLIIYLIIK